MTPKAGLKESVDATLTGRNFPHLTEGPGLLDCAPDTSYPYHVLKANQLTIQSAKAAVKHSNKQASHMSFSSTPSRSGRPSHCWPPLSQYSHSSRRSSFHVLSLRSPSLCKNLRSASVTPTFSRAATGRYSCRTGCLRARIRSAPQIATD